MNIKIAIEIIYKIISSRYFHMALIVLLFLLLGRQCSINRSMEIESKRHYNNYLTQRDSLKIIKKSEGTLIFEKSVLENKLNELDEDRLNLLDKLDVERKRKPKVIIEEVIVYVDTGSGDVGNTYNPSDSSGTADFLYNPPLEGGNYMKIYGKIPYTLNLSDSLNPVHFERYLLKWEQKMKINSVLFRDKKDGRLYYRLQSDFPNLSFEEVQIVDLNGEEEKSAVRSMRKPFSIGFSAGYGILLLPNGYSTGPYLGVGINYNPKFLQFGK